MFYTEDFVLCYDVGFLQIRSHMYINNVIMIITGVVYISQLLNVTHTLQELYMSDNDIGDDGMKVISEALQHNKSLTTLHVGECGLSAKGTVVCI